METTTYILNLVSSKLIPLPPREIWKGHKPSLQCIHIWGCPTLVLKPKVNKLEARSKVCLFVEYSKGAKRHYFYCQVDQKVFSSIMAKFLEEDYVMSNRITRDIDWKTLEDTLTLAK